jgi:broad specificity phosphatase PhoE
MPGDRLHTQTVVFLRHGVAHHNFSGADLLSPTLFDPSLTSEGKLSAVKTGEKIKTWWKTTQAGKSAELIVSSPLSRCLQTAMLAFLPGGEYERAAVPLLCIENVREGYGMHFPDKRRERSTLTVRSIYSSLSP